MNLNQPFSARLTTWAKDKQFRFNTKAVLVSTVVFGDFLLWTHAPVLALAMFLAGLVLYNSFVHFERLSNTKTILGLLGFVLGTIPLLETANVLTVVIAFASTFAVVLTFRGHIFGKRIRSWHRRLDLYVTAALFAPVRFVHLWPNFKRYVNESDQLRTQVAAWLTPILLASVFVGLFAMANPVWEQWLLSIELEALLTFLFSGRVLFWIALIWFSWPFLERSAPAKRMMGAAKAFFKKRFFNVDTTVTSEEETSEAGFAFFKRCLILFNAVFLAQTMLDLTYLWGGMSLPEGMTYASYAHRGAYPLVAAAIFAGLFVIIAMRPNGPGEKDATVKWLVLAWVAQNLLLVASSLLRLELYIEAYALTYWRVAALIWMLLVMAGLVLVVVRFATGRSTEWLIVANVFALVGTLYCTSLVNFPHVIARYNLSNLEAGGNQTHARFDYRYIENLGAYALPAVREQMKAEDRGGHHKLALERVERTLMYRAKCIVSANWRGWSYRGQRLKWYLNAQENESKAPYNSMNSLKVTP